MRPREASLGPFSMLTSGPLTRLRCPSPRLSSHLTGTVPLLGPCPFSDRFRSRALALSLPLSILNEFSRGLAFSPRLDSLSTLPFRPWCLPRVAAVLTLTSFAPRRSTVSWRSGTSEPPGRLRWRPSSEKTSGPLGVTGGGLCPTVSAPSLPPRPSLRLSALR